MGGNGDQISSKEEKLVEMNPMNLSRRKSPLALPFNKFYSRSSLRNHLQVYKVPTYLVLLLVTLKNG